MSIKTDFMRDSDYVTKGEFGVFKDEMYEFKVEMNEFKEETKEEFGKVRLEVREMFREQRKELNEDYERHTGMILEEMNHKLRSALELVPGVSRKRINHIFKKKS